MLSPLVEMAEILSSVFSVFKYVRRSKYTFIFKHPLSRRHIVNILSYFQKY